MTKKVIQTVAVVGLAGVAIACLLSHAWLVAAALAGLATYIALHEEELDAE
jgi:hypothetical protein